jgi:hypothetical protein
MPTYLTATFATRFNDPAVDPARPGPRSTPTWSWPTRPTPPGATAACCGPAGPGCHLQPSDRTGHRQRKASGVGDHPRSTLRPSWVATWSSARSGPSSSGVGSQPVTTVMNYVAVSSSRRSSLGHTPGRITRRTSSGQPRL